MGQLSVSKGNKPCQYLLVGEGMLKYGTDLHLVLNSNQFSQHLVAFYYLLNRFLLVRFRQVEIIKIAPNIIFRAFPHSDTVRSEERRVGKECRPRESS